MTQAYRDQWVSASNCSNPKDRSPFRPLVVINMNNLIGSVFNGLADGEVFSSASLICQDPRYECALPQTYYKLPTSTEFQNTVGPQLETNGINWYAVPSVYQNYTPPSGEDFLTRFGFQDQKTKVCWDDLENGYLNADGDREMTYESEVRWYVEYNGTKHLCRTTTIQQVVKTNDETASGVEFINDLYTSIEDEVDVDLTGQPILTVQEICRIVGNIYFNVVEPILINSSLRISDTITHYQTSFGSPSELNILNNFSTESFSQNFIAGLSDSILRINDLQIVWDDSTLSPVANPEVINTLSIGTHVYGFRVTGNDIDYRGNLELTVLHAPVKRLEENRDIKVYPNPANHSLKIQSDVAGTLNIYSSSGQLMISDEIINSSINNINLGKLPTGLYQVIIIDNDGAILNKQSVSVIK